MSPPRIPTSVEIEAKQLISPNQRSDLREKAKAEQASGHGVVPAPPEGGASSSSSSGPIVIYDDWKQSDHAHRDLGRPWTGRSRFEVSDGSWREVAHDEFTPRRKPQLLKYQALRVYPSGEVYFNADISIFCYDNKNKQKQKTNQLIGASMQRSSVVLEHQLK